MAYKIRALTALINLRKYTALVNPRNTIRLLSLLSLLPIALAQEQATAIFTQGGLLASVLGSDLVNVSLTFSIVFAAVLLATEGIFRTEYHKKNVTRISIVIAGIVAASTSYVVSANAIDVVTFLAGYGIVIAVILLTLFITSIVMPEGRKRDKVLVGTGIFATSFGTLIPQFFPALIAYADLLIFGGGILLLLGAISTVGGEGGWFSSSGTPSTPRQTPSSPTQRPSGPDRRRQDREEAQRRREGERSRQQHERELARIRAEAEREQRRLQQQNQQQAQQQQAQINQMQQGFAQQLQNLGNQIQQQPPPPNQPPVNLQPLEQGQQAIVAAMQALEVQVNANHAQVQADLNALPGIQAQIANLQVQITNIENNPNLQGAIQAHIDTLEIRLVALINTRHGQTRANINNTRHDITNLRNDVIIPLFTLLAQGQVNLGNEINSVRNDLTAQLAALELALRGEIQGSEGRLTALLNTLLLELQNLQTQLAVAPKPLKLKVDPEIAVLGGPHTVRALHVRGGTAPYRYRWELYRYRPPSGTGFTSASSRAIMMPATIKDPKPVCKFDLPGLYYLKCEVTDGAGAFRLRENIVIEVVKEADPFQVRSRKTKTFVNARTQIANHWVHGGTPRFTYNWSIVRTPTGGAITLSNITAERPSFTPTVVGNYIFELEVRDGMGRVDSTHVVIYAGPPPVVRAESERLATLTNITRLPSTPTFIVSRFRESHGSFVNRINRQFGEVRRLIGVQRAAGNANVPAYDQWYSGPPPPSAAFRIFRVLTSEYGERMNHIAAYLVRNGIDFTRLNNQQFGNEVELFIGSQNNAAWRKRFTGLTAPQDALETRTLIRQLYYTWVRFATVAHLINTGEPL